MEALAAQVGRGVTVALLVTSGLDESQHAAHGAQAAELGVTTIREAEPGLSIARNAALAACRQDVIAYIDDDAIVAGDWGARLARRWEEAEPEVACIGGPIVPRWTADPPAWVSEAVHPVLSLLDRGPGLSELDPRRREEVWGANISFRAHDLRALGGFDPARGPYASLPLFGDESLVQRRLAEEGLRVLYAGDVRVEHVIDANRLRLAEVMRRRLYYGALLGATAQSQRLPAALRAVSAAGGMLPAAVTRRHRLLGERAVRAATSAGIAAAPLVRAWLGRRHGWPGGGSA